MDGQGNLERTWKVREKSGNLKTDSYGSLQKIIYSVLFILFRRGKDVLSHEKAHLPRHRGLLLKVIICFLGEQILSFKSSPQI